MPKSCLNGYLTEGCRQCSDWNHNGIGCGANIPIDWCPHFKKMYEEEEAKIQSKNSKDAK